MQVQHDEIRRFNYIGDTQFVTGEVVAKGRDGGGRNWVEIEMRATNQRDEVTVVRRRSQEVQY